MDGQKNKLVEDIVNKSELIAKIIKNGHDVELRHSPNGIKIWEVKKTVVTK